MVTEPQCAIQRYSTIQRYIYTTRYNVSDVSPPLRAGLEALGGVHQARLDVGAAIEPAVEDWAQHPEGNREANAQEQGETGKRGEGGQTALTRDLAHFLSVCSTAF